MIAGQHVIRADGSRWLIREIKDTQVQWIGGLTKPATLWYLESENGQTDYVLQYGAETARACLIPPAEKLVKAS